MAIMIDATTTALTPEITAVAPNRRTRDRAAAQEGHPQLCGECGQPLGWWGRDKLTGLLDRWAWDDQAAAALGRARHRHQTLALLMADIDRFKLVNDEHGHLAGDCVLQAVADVLRAATRSDDLLGRYGGHGGDEFLILLPDTSGLDAMAVAQRIRCDIADQIIPVTTAQHLAVTITGVTASIGIAIGAWDQRHLDVVDLLDEADTALREAKTGGRNRIRTAVHEPMIGASTR